MLPGACSTCLAIALAAPRSAHSSRRQPAGPSPVGDLDVGLGGICGDGQGAVGAVGHGGGVVDADVRGDAARDDNEGRRPGAVSGGNSRQPLALARPRSEPEALAHCRLRAATTGQGRASERAQGRGPTHVMEESARLVTAAGLASWEPLPLQPREKPLAAASWSCMLTNVTLTRSPRLPSPAGQGRWCGRCGGCVGSGGAAAAAGGGWEVDASAEFASARRTEAHYWRTVGEGGGLGRQAGDAVGVDLGPARRDLVDLAEPAGGGEVALSSLPGAPRCIGMAAANDRAPAPT
jgi:hypothetical protein